MTAAPRIFDFDNYRKYLLAVIEHRRTLRRSYRRADFARAIGFASDAGLNMVLTGKRELRPPYMDHCIRNLKLGTHERLYFEAMIRSQGLKAPQRRSLLREVEMLSGKWLPPVPGDGFRLVDLFIAQQILCLRGGYVSADEVLSRFRYPIGREALRTILDWMVSRGYAERRGDEYKIAQSVMMAGDEFTNAALRAIHTDSFRLAEAALREDPIGDREFQTYYFTIERRRFGELKHRIKKMVIELISEFETELDADTVAQMHLNLFEAVKPPAKGRNP